MLSDINYLNSPSLSLSLTRRDKLSSVGEHVYIDVCCCCDCWWGQASCIEIERTRATSKSIDFSCHYSDGKVGFVTQIQHNRNANTNSVYQRSNADAHALACASIGLLRRMDRKCHGTHRGSGGKRGAIGAASICRCCHQAMPLANEPLKSHQHERTSVCLHSDSPIVGREMAQWKSDWLRMIDECVSIGFLCAC